MKIVFPKQYHKMGRVLTDPKLNQKLSDTADPKFNIYPVFFYTVRLSAFGVYGATDDDAEPFP